MKSLAILGASGHGRVVADMASLIGWDDIVFFDDKYPRLTTSGPWPVVGNTAALLESHGAYAGVVVAIGICRVRLEKHRQLREAGAALVSIVHPAASVSPRAMVRIGGVLMPGAVVNIGAALGEACIVNSGATVDHDCVIGDGVHIAPGAHVSGTVVIGEGSWIGVGATVRNDIAIGADVIVGAGAVVVKLVRDGLTVVGSPARPYKSAVGLD
ncbi:MAG: acetyltransferase [Gemmatimonadaceae bacterium]